MLSRQACDSEAPCNHPRVFSSLCRLQTDREPLGGEAVSLDQGEMPAHISRAVRGLSHLPLFLEPLITLWGLNEQVITAVCLSPRPPQSMLRGRGGCYKHTFYGIESHRCMEATPSLACANKCVFCWR